MNNILIKDAIKNIFAETLTQLVEKKPIEKITVKEIAAKSSLGRQTFYNHFNDKYDLINWIHEQKYNKILEIYDCHNTDGHDHILNFFQLICSNYTFYYKIAHIEGPDSFFGFMFKHTTKYYTNCISKVYGTNEVTKEVRNSVEFFTYAFVCMTVRWIKNGMKETPEYMAKLIINNMPSNLKKYYTYFN